MSVTEEEAKTRWCPFARHLTGPLEAPAPCNRDSNIHEPTKVHGGNNCIGSACMAWREAGSHWHLPNGGTWKTKEDVPPFRAKEVVEVKTGFCGLAGAPQ